MDALRRPTRRVALALLGALFVALPGRGQVGKSQGIIDPNVASEQQLLAVPHFHAALARSVLERRPFLSATDLDALLARSLNRQQLTEVYRKLFVHINLNTASNAEMQLIPGMGSKMIHEFEEYRPYRALAQFRREIGKYVDASELARLEQYVFVPVSLNTASDADIQSIPGIGSRLLHEFKEYRPYRSLEQFRREIGKYVDAKELSRLERYVSIN